MSIGPGRALSSGRAVAWRTALLTTSLLLSTLALPPFFGLSPPVGPAGAVVDQGSPIACEAYGINWTACSNAFASNDVYAYSNGSAGNAVLQRVASTTDSGDASSWSFSYAQPAGPNRILFLMVATDNGEDVSGTPQFGSQSLGLVQNMVHSSGKPRVSVWGTTAPNVGTFTVTGNLAGTDKYTVGVVSYTGVDQTSPGDGVTTAEGDSGTIMTVTVPSEPGDLVLDATANIGNGAPSVGSGQTEIYNEEMGGSGATDHFATSSEEAGASTVQMRWSGKEPGKEWVSIGFNLNVAPPSLTGFQSPSATGEDFTDWNNPTDAFSSDDQYADHDRNGRQQDYYDYAFGIPDGATIEGIEVEVEGHDPDWSGNGVLLELSWDGGANYTSTGNWLNFPDGADAGYQTLGGPLDTWGRTWTWGELTNANFRSRVEKDGSDWTTANLDHLRVQVYYVSSPTRNDTMWRGFGLVLDPADEVQGVEVGVEWWRNNTAPNLNVTVSWDSGTTWAPNQTATPKAADDDTVEWLDFTSATTWDASDLSDTNLRVRVGTDAGGARLDYVTVRTTYNAAPEASNLRLQDPGGQSLAGRLLDPSVAYRFLFNVTDEDGWVDIGTDGAVGLWMWYDGNETPELTFTEQTNGSNYRIELRYEDLADPGNATLDEWSVTEGSARYNASASVLTPILSGPTLIGYEFNLSVTLGLNVKAAAEPTNATPGDYNDPDSWNVEALVTDGSIVDREPRAAGGAHMEFGVFALALIDYSASASPTTIQPGDSTVFQVNFDNTGQGSASRVWVNLTFPAELSYVGDDAATIGGVRTCCESFEFTNVDPGSNTFNVTASATGGVANGTVVWTNVTYESLDAKGRPINQSAEDVSVIIVNADMSFSVSASSTSLQPGDSTVFQVDFTNSGQGDAGTVWVNITLPGELSYVGDDAASIGGVGTCCYDYAFVNIGPGTYSFNITAMANGGVVNGTVATTNFTLEVVDTLWAPLPPAYQDVDVTAYNAVLDFAVTVDPSLVWPGAQTTFQISFTNSGQGRAATVWVNVTLPSELSYLSDDASAIGGVLSGSYDYAFTNVAPGAHTFNVTVSAVGGVANGTVVLTRFVMEGLDLAGAPLSGETQDVPVTLANAVLDQTLIASSVLAEPGDSLTFTLTLSNLGAAPAEVLTLTGSVDANATYVSSSPLGTYDAPARQVRWNLASLVAGGQLIFQWTVSVSAGASDGATVFAAANTASHDTSGAPLPSLADSVQVDVIFASFAPVFVVTPLTAERGDEVVATAYFNNTGAGFSGTVWLNWTLHGHYQLLSLTPAISFTTTAVGFNVALPVVAPGPQRLDARLRVIRGLDDGLALDLDLSFTGTYRNGNLLAEADLFTSVSLHSPDMEVSLATSSGQLQAGAPLLLTVTVRNTGQAAASGWLNLTLPAGVAYRGDDGTFAVTEAGDRVSWAMPSIAAGEVVTLVVTLTAQNPLGLQSFRFTMEFTDGKGSRPISVVSNAVSVQIGPASSTPPFPWMYLLIAALVGGIVLFALARRRKRSSIEEVFVVHETGVLIAHRSKTLTPDKDEDVLAAMLSTVQTFIQDAFTEHEDTRVRGLQFDKFNILVEQGTHHYVAVVFRGRDNGALQARLHQLSGRIEFEFAEVLADWSGTSSDVRPVKALLPLLWGKRIAREKKEDRRTAPVAEEAPETPADQLVEEASPPAITGSQVRRARKAELQAWCLQLGLDDSGTVAILRRRLLREIKTSENELPSEPEAEPDLPEEVGDEDLEVGLDQGQDSSSQDDEIGADDTEPSPSIEAEIEAIGEELDALPEEIPELAPESSVPDEVATPLVVLGDAKEARRQKKRMKAKKKAKKARKGKVRKENSPAAETASEEEVEEIPEDRSEVVDASEAESEPEASPEASQEAAGPLPELTVKQIWDAPKSKLQQWCQQLGIDDTGPIMNMRLRLLSRIESS